MTESRLSARTAGTGLAGRKAESPVQLSDGEYFLLGDNRDSSEDSRFANVGNVTLEQISGKGVAAFPASFKDWIYFWKRKELER